MDLDKTNNLEVPNDAVILKEQREMKLKLKDYVKAMLDSNKTNNLVPNDESILKAQEDVKLKLKNVWNQILLDVDKVDVLQSNHVLLPLIIWKEVKLTCSRS